MRISADRRRASVASKFFIAASAAFTLLSLSAPAEAARAHRLVIGPRHRPRRHAHMQHHAGAGDIVELEVGSSRYKYYVERIKRLLR